MPRAFWLSRSSLKNSEEISMSSLSLFLQYRDYFRCDERSAALATICKRRPWSYYFDTVLNICVRFLPFRYVFSGLLQVLNELITVFAPHLTSRTIKDLQSLGKVAMLEQALLKA